MPSHHIRYILYVLLPAGYYIYTVKNNVRTATISFPPGNRQLDSAIQNSYTKDNKRALSTDG